MAIWLRARRAFGPRPTRGRVTFRTWRRSQALAMIASSQAATVSCASARVHWSSSIHALSVSLGLASAVVSAPVMDSDDALIARSRRGDLRAFEMLVERHRDVVF